MSSTNDNKGQLRFFKVFIRAESSTELMIPIRFGREYKQVLTENFGLQTEYSSLSWNVKIEERNEEHYFTKGWPKFVKDNQLDTSYLVFELIEKSTFNVSIFNLTGCEKELPSSYAAAREMAVGTPHFHLKLKNYHKYYVNIPEDFAQKAGLSKKRGITLVDPRGTQWPVGVIRQDNPFRSQTSTGWNDFITAQTLRVGSEILIESMAGSKDVFRVKVLKECKNGELLKATDKNKGRLALAR